MVDERVGKLARLLVDYSIQAGEGDQVLVSGEVGAGPLIRALYAQLLQVGATPITQIILPGMQEIFFEHAQGFTTRRSRRSHAPSTRAWTPRSASCRRAIPWR